MQKTRNLTLFSVAPHDAGGGGGSEDENEYEEEQAKKTNHDDLLFHPFSILFPSIFVRPCAAPQAVAVGVRGIVVSNHGGRACGNAIGLEA